MRLLKCFPLTSVLIFIFIIGWGVNNLKVCADPHLVIERFPTQVGKSWEYRRTFYTMFYDTSYADTSEEYMIDSLHSEFQVIDSIQGWRCYRYNLILFQATDTFYQTRWYAHPDTALLRIASSGQSIVAPPGKSKGDIKLKLDGKYFNTLEEVRNYLFEIRNSPVNVYEPETDFLSLPKKLFVFPLRIGRDWVAMTEPWLEERSVVDENYVVVPGGGFLTLKVKINLNIEDVIWDQWISKSGIVKDSLHVKGIWTNYMGDTLGYWEGYDKYELLDYKTDVKEPTKENLIPKDFSLRQNYPNPFNPTTTIQFRVGSLRVGETSYTTLKIYNIKGQLVRTLLNEERLSGNHKVIWDGKDNSCKEVASGIYFYQLKTRDYSKTKKMVLLR